MPGEKKDLNSKPLNPSDKEKIQIQRSAAGLSKDWEQIQGNPDTSAPANIPVSIRPDNDRYETSLYTSLENRATEDDELNDEISSDHFPSDYMYENDLEQADQDFRDGENHGADDQDDFDELRNGK